MNAVEQMAGFMTKEQAIELAGTGWWKSLPSKTVFRAQVSQPLLCMDFSAFHEAAEKALGRSVWTHEFADAKSLLTELDGKETPPDMLQIIDKLIDRVGPDRVVVVPGGGKP